MPETASEFDRLTDTWKEWQGFPWGKLYYDISRYNIQRHLDDRPKLILDIGGGNGADSIFYAKQGHTVTCLDASSAMLAEAKENAGAQGVSGNITFTQGNAEDIQERFNGNKYDLVLCHLMMEFLPEAPGFLNNLYNLVAPGGLLSVIDSNRYSLAYKTAFQNGDLVTAKNEIGKKEHFHPWVKRITRLYSGDETVEMLRNSGFEPAGHYGIQCACAYLPNERKSEKAYYDALVEFEKTLTDKYPYYLLARLYQIIGRKK
jgi:S-adenosylmethionine-dependent methyltransferase